MVQRTCQTCGKTYDTYPSVKPKYCSAACAGKAKRRGREKKCKRCGKGFWIAPSNHAREYCSKSCARSALNQTSANPAYRRDISGEKNPMYGRGRFGPKNTMYGRRGAAAPRWKGGRKIRKDGYVLVKAPEGHPHPSDVSRAGVQYILEHRLVMERALGRYLTSTEVVHHRDGNTSNNDLGNLELFADQAEHIRIGHATRESPES